MILRTLIFCLLAGAGAACSTGFPAPLRAALPEVPDQRLFSEAVLIATNNARCHAGRPALYHAEPLRKAAFIHSRNMVATSTFSHRTKITSASTLKKRVALANLRYRLVAENLALLSRFQFGSGQPFSVEDRAACKFRNPLNGQVIPPHSYKTLAEETVRQWMGSPGHKKNLLSKRLARLGASAIFAPTNTCGQFYITQVFAD